MNDDKALAGDWLLANSSADLAARLEHMAGGSSGDSATYAAEGIPRHCTGRTHLLLFDLQRYANSGFEAPDSGMTFFEHACAAFGANPPVAPGLSAPLALADPWTAETPLRAQPGGGSYVNRVVLVGRGGCTFTCKARHLQTAGAAAMVLIADTETVTFIPDCGSEDASDIAIPVVMVGSRAGAVLKRVAMEGANGSSDEDGVATCTIKVGLAPPAAAGTSDGGAAGRSTAATAAHGGSITVSGSSTSAAVDSANTGSGGWRGRAAAMLAAASRTPTSSSADSVAAATGKLGAAASTAATAGKGDGVGSLRGTTAPAQPSPKVSAAGGFQWLLLDHSTHRPAITDYAHWHTHGCSGVDGDDGYGANGPLTREPLNTPRVGHTPGLSSQHSAREAAAAAAGSGVARVTAAPAGTPTHGSVSSISFRPSDGRSSSSGGSGGGGAVRSDPPPRLFHPTSPHMGAQSPFVYPGTSLAQQSGGVGALHRIPPRGSGALLSGASPGARPSLGRARQHSRLSLGGGSVGLGRRGSDDFDELSASPAGAGLSPPLTAARTGSPMLGGMVAAIGPSGSISWSIPGAGEAAAGGAAAEGAYAQGRSSSTLGGHATVTSTDGGGPPRTSTSSPHAVAAHADSSARRASRLDAAAAAQAAHEAAEAAWISSIESQLRARRIPTATL